MRKKQEELELDDKDLRILEMLKQNSNLTTSKISKKTRIPITTIHNRIMKMKKEGIIKKYTIDINYRKLGRPLHAFIFMNPDYDFLKKNNLTQMELLDKIAKESNVEKVYQLIGLHDAILKVRLKDMDDLHYFFGTVLRKKYGVMKTETMIVSYESPI